MQKKTFIIILAALVALMPYWGGFPSAVENAFYCIAGLLIVLFSIDWSFLKRKKGKQGRSRKAKQASSADTFVESAPRASAAALGGEKEP